MIETRTVIANGTEISFQLHRKKVKNINLSVKHNGTVYVSASPSISLKDIDALIIKHADFILKAHEKFLAEHDNTSQSSKYLTGEQLTILGESHTLEITEIPRTEAEHAKIEDCVLHLYVHDPDDTQKKESLIHSLLSQMLNEIINTAIPIFQKEMNALLQNHPVPHACPNVRNSQQRSILYPIESPTLTIRKMKSLWGSCMPRKNKITFNWYLIQTPKHCIEYVILHELCHFVYQNHSKEFYQFLGQIMPDHLAYRKELKSYATFLRQ